MKASSCRIEVEYADYDESFHNPQFTLKHKDMMGKHVFEYPSHYWYLTISIIHCLPFPIPSTAMPRM
jgi:hypothetical protein